MHKRILVTGGAGFVGSSLAVAIAQRAPSSTRVFALDNLKRRGSEMNLPRLSAAEVEFVHGDIRRPEDLAGFDPELILDCAAEPSVQAGYAGSPGYLVRTNLEGAFNCLELARRTRADFLFLSTSRVYPLARLNALAYAEEEDRFRLLDDQPFPGAGSSGISEDFPMDGARSLYGMTKLAAELMILEFADAYGFRAVVNRCGLIAGPWQMPKSDQGVVTLWMAAHFFGKKLRYVGFGGKGKQVRDMLHIDDLVDLVWLQLADLDKFHGRVFNAGGGLSGSVSLRQLTALCRQVTGKEISVEASHEQRPADIPIYISDCRRLTRHCGWAPARTNLDLIESIHDWIRANESLLAPVLCHNL